MENIFISNEAKFYGNNYASDSYRFILKREISDKELHLKTEAGNSMNISLNFKLVDFFNQTVNLNFSE